MWDILTFLSVDSFYKKKIIYYIKMLSKNLRLRLNRSRSRSRRGGGPDCRTSDDCNQAKFIEIENDTIIQGLDAGTLNKNPNYKDKNYFKLVNQYNAINQGVRVGDILYFKGGEPQYSCYVALQGRVYWLGDDGDTPDFMLNLMKYKPILERHNVKYGKLFRNQAYYVLKNKNKLKRIPDPNPLISTYLLGSAVETSMPAEILNTLAEDGFRI